MIFAGFPERALDFYEGLEADNSKAYWSDHKDVFDADVKEPMAALVTALEPEFGAAKVFRPYRDVRFSKDKTPYKTHAGAVVQGEGLAGLYVQLGADGLMVAGGGWMLATAQARRLRAAAAQDGAGRALVRVLAGLEAAGFAIGGDRLQRVPPELKGAVAEDDPRAPLLVLKSLTASRHHPPEPWLHTHAALDVVREGWRALAPLNAWLVQHVGTA